jgi:hypothetical protein
VTPARARRLRWARFDRACRDLAYWHDYHLSNFFFRCRHPLFYLRVRRLVRLYALGRTEIEL